MLFLNRATSLLLLAFGLELRQWRPHQLSLVWVELSSRALLQLGHLRLVSLPNVYPPESEKKDSKKEKMTKLKSFYFSSQVLKSNTWMELKITRSLCNEFNLELETPISLWTLFKSTTSISYILSFLLYTSFVSYV